MAQSLHKPVPYRNIETAEWTELVSGKKAYLTLCYKEIWVISKK